MTFQIRRVTVLGTGVLGSQIAFQTAFHGFETTAYNLNDEALAAGRGRLTRLAATYRGEVPGAGDGKAEETAAGITLAADLGQAARDADLVIEAVPEVPTIKQEIYKRLSEVAPARTIFATNSSTLLPSDMKDFTGRPDRFLGLHFANNIWKRNIAEVMGTSETDPEVYRAVVEFATSIGMVPIELHKEKSGYLLNSMLVPFLTSAIALGAGEYAKSATVDETWRIGLGVHEGPFQILDIIGLRTVYNILAKGREDERRLAVWLKENYIDKGKLGVATGEGFYRYQSSPTNK